MPYLISKILFDLQKYQDVVDYLEPLVDLTTCSNYVDIVLLQAKSFYYLEKYDPAIAYFEEYKTFADTLNQKDLYQIGFAYYK